MKRPHRSARIHRISFVSLLIALAAPGAAQAQLQPDAQQKAAAEALFDEGRQLFAQGQIEQACRKFEQSQEVAPGVGILLYLGDCYERVGRFASAWATFRSAASKAAASGQADRARIADEHARKLSVRLSKLVLLVPQDDQTVGFELLLNGRVISPALFGVPFPVDPGQHQITARAPGRATWTGSIEVQPTAESRSVQIPLLAAGSAAAGQSEPAPPRASAASANGNPSNEAAAPHSADRGPDRTASYVLGGLGVAAIGVGVVFGLRASDKDEQAKAGCPSNCITQKAADLNESARTSALIANISYSVGAVALLSSAYLWFFTGSSSESVALDANGLGLGASLGPNEGVVSITGSF
jgi:tetratricopeptide (TPR) repeat protein